MTSVPAAGAPAMVRPVAMPLVDRIASGVVTAVPPIMLAVAMWFGWAGNLLDWRDILILVLSYVVIGTGVTVGFHRLLTHRSFKTSRLLRAAFAALGSAAADGPVIDWVATHRKHHQFSDVEGDPHSPHVGHGTGWSGALRGLMHAHIGWVFTDMEVADEKRYAKDLLADPMIRFVDRTFVLWVLAGLGCGGCWPVSAAPSASGLRSAGLSSAASQASSGVARPGSSCCTTRRSASTRSATSSAGATTRRPTNPATWRGWRFRLGARPGTTTTTRFRPPTVTVCAAGRSIPRPASSAYWR